MCFRIVDKPILFSGDTLFPGGPGNTSLDGGDFRDDHRLHRGPAVRGSAPDTLVLPGHGDDTTIGAESPHLQEWIDRGW
ncbi:MAG: MBL fold metallo-hydrolase [Microthrixaceae bacterium]|nr:MBL fold metallo-hydrolase [Microthrixaceae bacterium]